MRLKRRGTEQKIVGRTMAMSPISFSTSYTHIPTKKVSQRQSHTAIKAFVHPNKQQDDETRKRTPE